MSILSLSRKQRAGMLVAGVLMMMLVALLVQPGVANAQEGDTASLPQGSQPAYESAKSLVVVDPGDTLWSISQQRLHPNATSEEITNEVGRIHELNRSRIGDDPNLILPGQELLLPLIPQAATAAPSTTVAKPAAPTTKPTAVAERAPAGPVEEQQPTITLPDMPEAELMAVSPIGAEPSLLESYAGIQRKQLGLGIIALTIIIASIMAWRLSMNRNVGGPTVWGIPGGYGYSESYALLHSDSEDTASTDEQNSGSEEEDTSQELPRNESEDQSPRDQTRSALRVVNYPEEADPEEAEAVIEVVEELISGTAVWDDELELAQLRKLPLNEQLEVGIVLREARRQEELPPEHRKERLARVSNVQDARSFLECG